MPSTSEEITRTGMAKIKINILLLQSIFHLGGAEKVTHEIFTRMDKDYFNTVICTLYEPGPMGEAFSREGFPFYSNLIKKRYDLSAFFKLNKIIRKHRIDIIYLINQPLTVFWGIVAGKYNRIPVVPVIHNTPVLKEHRKLEIYRLFLPKAARVITVSEMQKCHLYEKEGISIDNVEVIHNGIDFEKFFKIADRDETLSEFNLPSKTRFVGIVTRLVTLKGVDVFIRSAAIVIRHMENVQFLIVGDGPERENLARLTRELGIEQQVIFLGISHEIGRLISIFDVAVLSSRTEALPLVLLEYLSSGKPVVASAVGSIAEVVTDESNGFLVESEDSQKLAERIILLLRDNELAKSFGRKGLETVKSLFSIEKTVLKTQLLIEDVVGRHGKDKLWVRKNLN